MPLQNFVDYVGPKISAAWLNSVDRLRETVFEDASTKALARTALTADAPLEVANGGTGRRTSAANLYFDVRFYGAVGDGVTDDTAAFNAAFAAAAVVGAEVYVPAATVFYLITSALLVPSGISIRGDGYGSIIKQETYNVANFFLDGVSNVWIHGLHFQGAIQAITMGRVTLNSVNQVVIEENFFTNFTGQGVHSYGTPSNVTIRRNVFHSWITPINGSSAINVYNNASQFTVENNLIDGGSSSTTTGADFGISFLRSSGSGLFEHIIISENHVEHIREYGIVVYANEDNTTDVTISDNTVDYVYSSSDSTSTGAGIYLLRPGNTTVVGNTIGHTNIFTSALSLAPGGIGVNGAYGTLVIANNTIHDTTQSGIFCVSGLVGSSVVISGNTIQAASKIGIYVYEQSNTNVIGNAVTTTSSVAGVAAIIVLGDAVTHAKRIIVSHNTILAAGSQHVQLTNVDNLTFSNNNMKVLALSGTGVSLSLCDKVVIAANIIDSDATSGVALNLSNVTGGRVIGNSLLCNHSADYYATVGTCTGTFADESNMLERASNAGTGSNVVLRCAGAVPAAGSYQQGDRVQRIATVSGGAPGWFCTVAPSTWKALAALPA